MRRLAWFLLGLLGFGVLAGCTAGKANLHTANPYLLFDRRTPAVSANGLVHHSGWPSVTHQGPTFETVLFRTRLTDIQDSRSDRADRTYRRSDTIRVGRQFR